MQICAPVFVAEIMTTLGCGRAAAAEAGFLSPLPGLAWRRRAADAPMIFRAREALYARRVGLPPPRVPEEITTQTIHCCSSDTFFELCGEIPSFHSICPTTKMTWTSTRPPKAPQCNLAPTTRIPKARKSLLICLLAPRTICHGV